jgi:hypothetical protein
MNNCNTIKLKNNLFYYIININVYTLKYLLLKLIILKIPVNLLLKRLNR